MFNHSCRPNCETFGGSGMQGAHDGRTLQGRGLGQRSGPAGEGVSEIVANRPIAAGTELTISYLHPIEQTHAHAKKKFERQHFCDPGPSPWPLHMEAFLYEEEDDFTQEMRAECSSALAQVEESLDHIDDLLEGGDATHKFGACQSVQIWVRRATAAARGNANIADEGATRKRKNLHTLTHKQTRTRIHVHTAFAQLKSEMTEAESLLPASHVVVICRARSTFLFCSCFHVAVTWLAPGRKHRAWQARLSRGTHTQIRTQMCRINNMLVRSATELMAGQKKPNAAMMVAVLRASLQVLDAMHGGLAGKSRRHA